ncbi:MAG: hypothetical protein ACQSGP_20200 [Frankia sp.]
MNAAELTPGMTIVESRPIGRTHARGLYRYALGEVAHTPDVIHYQLTETGEIRTAAPNADIRTCPPDHAIEIVYLPARGTAHVVSIEPTKATFQALVGGDLQRLPLAGATLIIQRDARDFDALYNPIASRIVQAEHRCPAIYGNAVLHGPTRDDNRRTSVPAVYLARLGLRGTRS